MERYHKIQSIFYRDPDTKFKSFIEGKFSDPSFTILQNVPWDFTEKVDGTNIRIGWNGGWKGNCEGQVVQFAGRSNNAQLPGQLRIYLEEYFTDELLGSIFQDSKAITLIGEGYGGKIQKMGKVYGDDQRFILFDIFVEPCEDHPLGIWLERDAVTDIACELGIPCVPVIFTNTLMVGYLKLKERPDFDSQVSQTGQALEGFVARPQVELRNRFGSRIITKIKGKDFTNV